MSLTTTEIAALASDLCNGRTNGIVKLFRDEGLPDPAIVFDPEPAAIAHPVLADLLAAWNRTTQKTALLQEEAVRGHWHNVALLDLLEGGWDFRYVHYGQTIAAAFGQNLEGSRTSELPSGGFVAAFLLVTYRAAILRAVPVFTEHSPPRDVGVDRWQRLVLPLHNDYGRPSQLLVGIVDARSAGKAAG